MKHGVPKSFKMAGHTIKVKIVKRWKFDDAAAIFFPERYEIHIPADATGTDLQQRFAHEFMHLLFNCAGRTDLYEDEALVDACGHLLQQALASFE